MVHGQTVHTAYLVVKLQGGIGNQLFQLSFGDYLSGDLSSPVAYLTDAFNDDPYGRKNIVPRLFPDAPLVQLSDIAGPHCRMLQETMLTGQLLPGNLIAMLHSQAIQHCILDGYWQDTGYVSNTFAGKLRAAMESQASHLNETDFARWADRIDCSSVSVAVHVRRHDYKHHGICHETYYIDCLRWITKLNPSVEVYVFSDEPNYTGHFLRNAGIFYQLVSSGDDMLDLLLMARCQMHVIANSSFSWWGARLSHSKLILYPAPWSQVQTPSPTLFPSHWHQIDGAVEYRQESISFAQCINAIRLTK
jgi:hypothetical protein